jgi:integrase
VLLTDVTEDAATLYLLQLTNHRGGPASPKYRNNVRGYLSTFFAWCVRKGRLDRNPIDRIDTFQDDRGEQIATPTAEEVVRLIETTRTRKGGKVASEIYEFTAYTGLRREELEQLQVLNFVDDRNHPHLYLQPKKQKGKHTERIPLVSQRVLDIVRRWAAGKIPTAKLLPKRPPHPGVVVRDWVRAGVGRVERSPAGKVVYVAQDDQGRRYVLHSIRHALGTMLARAGVADKTIQAILRHRDIRVTQKYIQNAQMPTGEGLAFVEQALSPYRAVGTACDFGENPERNLAERNGVGTMQGSDSGVSPMIARQAVARMGTPDRGVEEATGSSPVAPTSSGLPPNRGPTAGVA